MIMNKNMKKILSHLMAYALVCGISSCGSMQTVMVNGAPGTEIYSSHSGTKIGIIDDTGKAKIRISRNGYCAFLWSYDPSVDKYYPFGIDYEYGSLSKNNGLFFGFLMWPPMSLLYSMYDIKYLESDQYQEAFKYCKEQNCIGNHPKQPYANSGERRKLKHSSTKSPQEGARLRGVRGISRHFCTE